MKYENSGKVNILIRIFYCINQTYSLNIFFDHEKNITSCFNSFVVDDYDVMRNIV